MVLLSCYLDMLCLCLHVVCFAVCGLLWVFAFCLLLRLLLLVCLSLFKTFAGMVGFGWGGFVVIGLGWGLVLYWICWFWLVILVLLFGVFLAAWFAFWWCLLHSAVFC